MRTEISEQLATLTGVIGDDFFPAVIVRALLVDDKHMKAVIEIYEMIMMIKKRRKESGGRQTLPAGTPERRGDVAFVSVILK